MDEVLVACEVERAEAELAIALGVRIGRLNVGQCHVEFLLLMWHGCQLKQISAQRSMVSSPRMVCNKMTLGAVALMR